MISPSGGGPVTREPDEPVSAADDAPARPTAGWIDFADEALLDVRLCDLGSRSRAAGSRIGIADLQRELDGRGLTFRPHYWLSAEWFSPDGVPGVAIPFYLAHPRLMRLETAQMLEVEGGTPEWCMQILRHEAGHAFDNAYALRSAGERRQALRIARPSQYPDFYLPRPYSKSFVLHLDSLVRAEPSGRRLCGDVRRVAHARQRLAGALRGLAGAAEARIHGRADARDRGQTAASSRRGAASSRSSGCGRRCASTTRRSARTTASSIRTSTIAICAGCSPTDAEYRRNPKASRVHPVHPPRRAAPRRRVDRLLSIHDRPGHRGHDRPRQRAGPAPEVSRRIARKLDFTMLVTVQTMNYLHSGRHRVAL